MTDQTITIPKDQAKEVVHSLLSTIESSGWIRLEELIKAERLFKKIEGPDACLYLTNDRNPTAILIPYTKNKGKFDPSLTYEDYGEKVDEFGKAMKLTSRLRSNMEYMNDEGQEWASNYLTEVEEKSQMSSEEVEASEDADTFSGFYGGRVCRFPNLLEEE